MMKVTGAGILPLTSYSGDDYLLLGQEGSFFNRRWTDLGGSKDPVELTFYTAAREAFEESRGALGSKWGLILRLLCPGETVNQGQYVSYVRRWWVSSLQDIPDRFHQAHFSGHAYNEMYQLRWIKASDVYAAVMSYRGGSGKQVKTVSGDRLARRCIGVIRRSSGYRAYAAAQVSKISSGRVPVLHLKNGRVFAVMKSGKSADKLVVENRSFDGWWQRCGNLILWMLLQNPYDATTSERESTFHALRQESVVHRLYRQMTA